MAMLLPELGKLLLTFTRYTQLFIMPIRFQVNVLGCEFWLLSYARQQISCVCMRSTARRHKHGVRLSSKYLNLPCACGFYEQQAGTQVKFSALT